MEASDGTVAVPASILNTPDSFWKTSKHRFASAIPLSSLLVVLLGLHNRCIYYIPKKLYCQDAYALNLELPVRLELTTCDLRYRRSTIGAMEAKLGGKKGIEPSLTVPQTVVLPLHY